MTWTYVKAYKNLREMETIVINLSSMLHHKANAYDPHKVGAFSASSDLGQLQSAMKLAPLRLEVANNLRHGLIIYCIDTCLLIVIYAPLLWISFRGLYDRSSPSENVEAALGPVKPVKKNPISRKLNRDRRRLVSHALCVYVSTTLHLPPLILMLTRNVDNFMTDLTRREITYHGLNDPLAVMANIILLILNVNSHHIIRAQKKTNRLDPPYRPPACAADPIPEQQRGILKGLNDRSSKGSIVADNIHIALDNLHENVEYDEKVSPWAICATPGDLDPIRPLSGCDPPTNYSAR
ncbi:hypothetical protein PTTG_28208 [Puccinia triticina 1-1 BBBD Race 1]|uniref:Uncharacterized protein n=2 Tax=Puccinia triticina TaxID=208348 RepID=A0A180GFR3_PUCT1|nr:uncharacterized protein PtA15_18A357 [Puccinia triticina]OAV90793.1 hypothetical protein PTTG_28208 [Puccinia triticina 1-1 BBBD Race 1]WAQ93297.1 hypothetical protein PtA15_18A357 [Puccinia triticina]